MQHTTPFSICNTISTAWHNVRGSKGSLWAAIFIIALITVAIYLVGFVFGLFSHRLAHAVGFIDAIIKNILTFGILYMGIQHVKGLPISFRMLGRVLNSSRLINIVCLLILLFLIGTIPSLILGGLAHYVHIHGGMIAHVFISLPLYCIAAILLIYLSLRMTLAPGYLMDQQLEPWAAVKASFASTKGHVWSLFWINVVNVLILIIAAIPIFIGWIWAIPYLFVCYGTIYNKLAIPEKP